MIGAICFVLCGKVVASLNRLWNLAGGFLTFLIFRSWFSEKWTWTRT